MIKRASSRVEIWYNGISTEERKKRRTVMRDAEELDRQGRKVGRRFATDLLLQT